MLRGTAKVAVAVSLFAAPPGVLGRLLVAPDTLRHAGPTVPEPRLHIISVTGLKDIPVAAGMQRTCKRRMGPGDSYANVCDVGCANLSKGALDNVVEMGDSSFSAPLPQDPYDRAQVKYGFGLVQEVRRLSRLGGPLPAWWFIKDYDTYVNANHLMAWVKARASPEELVSYGQVFNRSDEFEGQDQLSGGWGWLLSRAMARKLGLDLRAEVLDFAALGCNGTACSFDGGSRGSRPPQGLPWFALGRIPGARLEGGSAFDLAGGASTHLKFELAAYAQLSGYAQNRTTKWTAEDAEEVLGRTLNMLGY